MKVILKRTVPKLGKEGQVVNVKDGYARNFLFPQGMAIVADKAQLNALDIRNNRIAAQLEETKAAAADLGSKIDGKNVKIQVTAGEKGRLFGAVTSQYISDSIKEQLGVEVDRKTVGILQPLKRLGTYHIEIDLHRLVDCAVDVEVFDPNYHEEEEVEEEVVETEEADAPAEAVAEEAAVEEAAAEATEEAPAEDAPAEEA
jgi:large subunit ribosomal protein L9